MVGSPHTEMTPMKARLRKVHELFQQAPVLQRKICWSTNCPEIIPVDHLLRYKRSRFMNLEACTPRYIMSFRAKREIPMMSLLLAPFLETKGFSFLRFSHEVLCRLRDFSSLRSLNSLRFSKWHGGGIIPDDVISSRPQHHMFDSLWEKLFIKTSFSAVPWNGYPHKTILSRTPIAEWSINCMHDEIRVKKKPPAGSKLAGG